MLVADVTIWLEVARILSVFNISKPRDAKGKEIDPIIAFTNGTVRFVYLLKQFMLFSG